MGGAALARKKTALRPRRSRIGCENANDDSTKTDSTRVRGDEPETMGGASVLSVTWA